MLLRSTSTPILKSNLHQSSSESDLGLRCSRSKVVSMFVSCNFSPPIEKWCGRISRTSSEGQIRVSIMGMREATLWSCSNLDGLMVGERCGEMVGGGGVGGHGGCDGDGPGGESIDRYYQKMIKAYPGDALLLGNYAKFLKEVQGDDLKAEEYCVRAILANPNDGNVLSMYGDLIWKTNRDMIRAKSYFDQAIESAPDDCYIKASNARFLWEAGKEGHDKDEDDDGTMSSPIPEYTRSCPCPKPPVTAAS